MPKTKKLGNIEPKSVLYWIGLDARGQLFMTELKDDNSQYLEEIGVDMSNPVVYLDETTNRLCMVSTNYIKARKILEKSQQSLSSVERKCIMIKSSFWLCHQL